MVSSEKKKYVCILKITSNGLIGVLTVLFIKWRLGTYYILKTWKKQNKTYGNLYGDKQTLVCN